MDDTLICPYCGNDDCAPSGDGEEDFEDGEQVYMCMSCIGEFKQSDGLHDY